jgi:hypothetical protein
VAQVSLAQQGCPEPPQAAQVPVVDTPVVWQTFPGEQVAVPPVVVLAQHGCVAPPQATQLEVPPAVAARHTVPGAVQRLFALPQQGFPRPPQVPHAPAAQMPVIFALQVFPAALQVAAPPPVPAGTQHPPSRQKLPGQHDSPEAPQESQVAG